MIKKLFALTAAGLLVVSGASYAAAPAPASAGAGGTAFVQAVAGDYYSAALRADGTVWTWGRAALGELGVLEPRTVTSVAAPVRIAALTDIAAISTSGHGAQAALRKDGTVWEWGIHADIAEWAFSRNVWSWGVHTDTPERTVSPQQVPGLTDIAAVAAVNRGGFALKKDGTLWFWTHDPSDGAPQAEQVPGTYRWSSMTSSGDLAFALDADGAVWVFGAKRTEGGGTVAVKPGKLAGLPAAMKQIAAKDGLMGGVDRNGAAWQWQLNLSGFYGDKAEAVTLAGRPAKLHPALKIKAVQIVSFRFLLLTAQGDVWTDGKRLNGKEGQVKGLAGIQSIAASDYHGLMIDAAGRLKGLGADKWNEAGVLRTSADGMEYAPVNVQTPIRVFVDGRELASPFPARMENGLISVPAKDVLNALGGSLTVKTGAAQMTYTASYGNRTAVIRLGEREIELDGRKAELPDAAYALDGVTMIPAALLKQLGVQAEWSGASGELKLNGGT